SVRRIQRAPPQALGRSRAPGARRKKIAWDVLTRLVLAGGPSGKQRVALGTLSGGEGRQRILRLARHTAGAPRAGPRQIACSPTQSAVESRVDVPVARQGFAGRSNGSNRVRYWQRLSLQARGTPSPRTAWSRCARRSCPPTGTPTSTPT